MPPLARSLSAKLLVLTVLFVMLAEVLIFTPSVARFRLTYLEERLAAGHLAALAVEAAPDRTVTEGLTAKLLAHVGAHAVDLIQPDSRVYMLARSMPPEVDATFDLRDTGFIMLIADAFSALARAERRAIRVIGPSPRDARLRVEVVLDESPMVEAMRDFAARILALSVVISLITAGLVFLALNGLFVRPMRRLTESVVAFARAPESAPPPPAGERTDEIGTALRELAAMQDTVRTALRQRERLAALGTAVAKINHDLRGILATASLLSERLGESADPEARRVTPRLMAALDRAVDLCGQTLSYTRDGVLPLRRQPVALAALVDEVEPEVRAGLRADGVRAEAAWVNAVPAGLSVTADRDQLARALVNLGRNAMQAGADTVTVAVMVAAQPAGGRVTLTVADTGPGLPPRAREHLFEPFAGSARAGGVGLGLAIAREIARAHGGDLRLVETTGAGTTFALDLPA